MGLFQPRTMTPWPAPVSAPPTFACYVNVEPSGVDVTATLMLDDGAFLRRTGRQRIDFADLPAIKRAWQGHLHLQAEGYQSQDLTVSVDQVNGAAMASVSLIPSRTDLPRLVVRGKYFALETGQRWTAIGCSDFALYARFLNGEDLTPILEERAALGFTLLRVWLLNTSVYRILPSDWGDRFYTDLPLFAQECAMHGLYVQFTATTQAASLLPGRDAQQAHLNRIATELRDETNWIGEAGNELNNVDNALADGLTCPPFGLWSRGEMAGDPGDNPPPRPAWHYENIHSFSASGEWQRTVGKQAAEASDQTGVPTIANENARFPDNDSSLMHAYDAAAGAALLSAGAVFHSWGGKLSTLFDERTHPCAEAWCLGAKSVPLAFQDGAYVHRMDLEHAGVLRVYGKRLPDGRECDVVIRP